MVDPTHDSLLLLTPGRTTGRMSPEPGRTRVLFAGGAPGLRCKKTPAETSRRSTLGAHVQRRRKHDTKTTKNQRRKEADLYRA